MRDSGADKVSKGISSASLAECLDRMGVQPSSSIPATCATGSGNIGDKHDTNPGQFLFFQPTLFYFCKAMFC